MTALEVLAAVGRRWYILLVVVLAAAALGFSMYRDSGSYFTRTSVTFTLPARSTLLPDSGNNDSSVIAFAGAIATTVNLGQPVVTYSSADAPYYGAGVREGVAVSLLNTGNQWTASFPSAMIDVQIVGRTSEWVTMRQQELLAEILQLTEAEQTAARPGDRITAQVEPLSTQVQQIAPSRTTQLVAFGALGLAALIAGTWLSVAVDRMVRRGRKARARQRMLRSAAPAVREVTA
ncbi:hypothetical protein ACH3VR_14515 [Microbacterium sp. B2969]|uniref:Polysaccharide chain length determinant N-terminal domain-containing protein n=1 Tax=Microbacterium alkaliflavum TaxID=3248839 RepID=A0ABW7QDS1_9MICO